MQHIGTTMAGSEPHWPQRPRAPRGAPNVVVVLVDDVGFADLGCQGSEIPTPNLDRLATEGAQFTNFHSTPMCSPTRAALLTGLTPHRAGVGHVAQDDPGFPGYRAEIADDVPTMAEALRDAGWATFCVGKWHLCRDADTSSAGPMHSWPCQRGFERFYGILDAFTNLHHPHQLVSDNTHLDIDTYPEGYHLTDDLTSTAVSMVRQRHAVRPDQPFFLYLAHPAAHAPLHARAEDIAAFAGVYDCGWDEVRARRHARQLELGVIPPGTVLPPRNPEDGDDVVAWDDLDADTRRLFATYMATYAAMVTHLDRSVGELRAALEEMGVWDDTILVFLSDNGASREGEEHGTTNYYNHLAAQVAATEDALSSDLERIEDIGGPRTMPHYPRGWAMASNTPFRLYKRNTHAGGHQVPCIIHVGRSVASGAGIDTPVGLRPQYAHCADLWPTVAALAGVTLPTERAGRPAPTPDGVPLTPVLVDPAHPEVRTEQLYELAGHRGLYRDGWEVVTRHRGPAGFDDGEWELYHLAVDPTETTDLAADDPERVSALSARWDALRAPGRCTPSTRGASGAGSCADPTTPCTTNPSRCSPAPRASTTGAARGCCGTAPATWPSTSSTAPVTQASSWPTATRAVATWCGWTTGACAPPTTTAAVASWNSTAGHCPPARCASTCASRPPGGGAPTSCSGSTARNAPASTTCRCSSPSPPSRASASVGTPGPPSTGISTSATGASPSVVASSG